MSKIIIDGKELDVPAEYTLLQACETAGAEVPRFCFHERLSVAGNCRMCLVEVKGGPPKPTASCAMAVKDLRPGPEGRAAGGRDQFADGAQGAQGRDRIPADQPSARLPDLRSGRRMRPAGSGDGLRRRHFALRREQARGRGQVHRRAGQDVDEPLHPVHALRPLRHRGRRRFRTRRDRPRRGHGDHHLSRAGADLRAAGQRRRSLPGRRADLEADRVPCAAVGIRQDRVGRRDGRARLGDPHRLARPRSHAHPAARQRGDQRGVDLRQDPPRRRRPQDPAARPALRARRRQARSPRPGAKPSPPSPPRPRRRGRRASARSSAISPASRKCSRSRG